MLPWVVGRMEELLLSLGTVLVVHQASSWHHLRDWCEADGETEAGDAPSADAGQDLEHHSPAQAPLWGARAAFPAGWAVSGQHVGRQRVDMLHVTQAGFGQAWQWVGWAVCRQGVGRMANMGRHHGQCVGRMGSTGNVWAG